MNVELLRKVQKLILAEPRRVNMNRWVDTADNVFAQTYYYPDCGTVGCIRGWLGVVSKVQGRLTKQAIWKAGRVVENESYDYGADMVESGAELIGCTYEQARGLFLGYTRVGMEQWPADLQRRLGLQRAGSPEYAAVVAEAIDRFINNPDEFTARR